MTHGIDERKRWLALIVLCLGVLMIVLDRTNVNVALPSIRADHTVDDLRIESGEEAALESENKGVIELRELGGLQGDLSSAEVAT
jgi:hypothetical protein